MKICNFFKISISLILSLSIGIGFFGCNNSDTAGEADGDETTTSTTTAGSEDNQTPEEEGGVDLVLFIGQSNMAGRGDSKKATVVKKGHAYEFRAISDPTKLYPLTEPFGVAENNSESGVTENKKTGSMVSAFCESYYEATGTPIVAVSCSKGGEKISFFDTATKVYADAVSRVNAAKEFLQSEYDSGKKEFRVKHVYVVWLQGESDGDAGTSASVYKRSLQRIVQGFKKDIGCDQTFIIPIGTYNGNNDSLKAKYKVIRDAQIEFCAERNDTAMICSQLVDLHDNGFMKDQFHFTQEGYEIIGKDAGANMAYFTLNGTDPECKPYTKE